MRMGAQILSTGFFPMNLGEPTMRRAFLMSLNIAKYRYKKIAKIPGDPGIQILTKNPVVRKCC